MPFTHYAHEDKTGDLIILTAVVGEYLVPPGGKGCKVIKGWKISHGSGMSRSRVQTRDPVLILKLWQAESDLLAPYMM